MKIDRSLFLVLTGVLAGSTACEASCNMGDHHAHPPPPPPAQPVANQSTPAATSTPATAPTSAPGTVPTPSRVVPLHLAHGGSVVPTPTPTPSPTPPSGCLDSSSTTVPACSTMPAVDSSCSANAFPAQKCGAYNAYFSPKVAASAIGCLSKLSGKQLCDSSQVYACGKTALSQACPDNSVAQLCGIAATSCKSTAADCTALLSGLNDAGKQQVAQCIAQGCQAGLYSCVEGLTSSTEGSAKFRRPM